MLDYNGLKYIINRNETKVTNNKNDVFRKYNKLFSTINLDEYKREETLGLEVVIAGKTLLTALASYQEDLELYKDTKNQFKGRDSRTIQTSVQTGMILATSNNDNLLNVDSRIVASKQILLLKVEEYNQKIKNYHLGTPLKWSSNLDFLSL